jgi:hypothetical protein
LVALGAASCRDEPEAPGQGVGGLGGEPQKPEPETPPPKKTVEIALPPPESLSETGIYVDLINLEFSSGVVAYEPRYPLWTNGSSKQRGISLPKGRFVEWNESQLKFPDGTVFVKTFSYGQGDDPSRKIETRMLYKLDGEWDYAAYEWERNGSDAHLLDGSAKTFVDVDVDGAAFQHTIPSRLDCRSCHESAKSTVLGFSALQLGGEQQLRDLTDGEVFSVAPRPVPAISGASKLDERVLAYFAGNCVHCHNGGDGPSSAFSLEPDQAFEQLIDRPTTGHLVAGYRVVSGAPEYSGLYLALSREGEVDVAQAMPPLGIDRRDDAAFELMGRWIEGLPITSETPQLGMGGDSGD